MYHVLCMFTNPRMERHLQLLYCVHIKYKVMHVNNCKDFTNSNERNLSKDAANGPKHESEIS